ncbi:MAG: hypothetical protein WAT39_06105 [Planctomycetota bacterium]
MPAMGEGMAHCSLVRSAVIGLGLALLAGNAAAQVLSVTPGVSLQVGDAATISYSDPSRANQSIIVQVSGGFPVPTVYEVQIQLDGKGKGSGTWTVVSGWRSACFDAPGTTGQVIPIF